MHYEILYFKNANTNCKMKQKIEIKNVYNNIIYAYY